MKKILTTIILLILLTTSASASIQEDISNSIGNIISNLKPLSLPYIGEVTVTCADGSAKCTYAGDNWHITTDVLSADQTLVLTLPSGTVYTDAATGKKATTGSTVKVRIIPDRAEIRKAVQPMTLTYPHCAYYNPYFGVACGYETVPGYEPSGATSFKRVFYTVELTSKGMVYTKNLEYDYVNQQAFFISDNNGNQAKISPRYIIDQGYNIEPTGVIYLDNGFGTYKPHLQSTFLTARTQIDAASSWGDYVTKLKENGMIEVTDLGQPTISNQQVILTYPGGTVGVSGEVLIPKAMASTVTVEANYGNPTVTDMKFSPTTWIIGQGLVQVTVYVTNNGGDDWFQVGIDQNVGTVNYISNRKYILAGKSDYFLMELNPTVNSEQTMSITATVTASGSNKAASKTKTIDAKLPVQDCGLFGCSPKTQKLKVTAYDPNKNTLSTAPIFINGIQVSSNGYYEKDLVYGEKIISTNNASNPKLYAPTPVPINLQGGEPKVVSLYFSNSPASDVIDLTWVFWLIAGVVVVFIAWRSGFAQAVIANPFLLVPIILIIAILWLILIVLGYINTLTASITSITTLGGLLK